jgi:DegV family protein with EDD domain
MRTNAWPHWGRPVAHAAIVTDASIDLAAETAGDLGIVVAPLGYDIGGKHYRSGDHSPAQLYAAISESADAHVEGVAADDLEAAFREAARSCDELICAVHSVGSSFTRVSAEVAMHRIGADEATIRLISPGRSTTALAAICIAGANAAKRGANGDEVFRIVEEASTAADAYFIARDLGQLERSGQLAAVTTQSNVGALDDGVPLFRVRGRLTAVSVHDSREEAEAALVEQIAAKAVGRQVIVVSTHAGAAGDRDRLAALGRTKLQIREEHATEMGPVVATLLGAGAYGLGFCVAG